MEIKKAGPMTLPFKIIAVDITLIGIRQAYGHKQYRNAVPYTSGLFS
jgi:hypothetical protein